MNQPSPVLGGGIDMRQRGNEDRGELLHALACGACEWVVEVETEALRYPDQDDESVEPPTVEGDCTLSSELGPGVSRIDSSRSSHRRRD
jgi:hypothetical protein